MVMQGIGVGNVSNAFALATWSVVPLKVALMNTVQSNDEKAFVLIHSLAQNATATSYINNSDAKNSTLVFPHAEEISMASKLTITIFLCIVIIVTVFGNGIALAAFFVSLQLRKATYYFIANLCFSDLTVAVFSMPFWISYVLTGWPHNGSGIIYTFWICLDIFCGSWSIMSLVMISIERYICIVFTYQYHKLVTKRRAAYMMVIVLACSTVACFLGFAQTTSKRKEPSIAIFFLSYVIPVLIKIFTYARIYKEARIQQNMLNIEQKNKERFDKERKRNTDIASSSSEAIKIAKNQSLHQKYDSSDDMLRDVSNTENDEWSFNVGLGTAGNCCLWRVLAKKRRSNHMVEKETDEGSETELNTIGDACSKSDSESNEDKDGIAKEALLFYQGQEQGDWSLSSDFGSAHHDDSTLGSDRHMDANLACLHSSPDIAESPCTSKSKPTESAQQKLRFKRQGASGVRGSGPFKNDRSMETNGNAPAKNARSFLKSDSLADIKHKSLVRFRKFQREFRAAKVVGMIIGTFLILWTPFMLVVILSCMYVPVSMSMVMVAKCLHYANSAINPILYVVLNRIFRKSVKKVFIKMGILRNGDRWVR